MLKKKERKEKREQQENAHFMIYLPSALKNYS